MPKSVRRWRVTSATLLAAFAAIAGAWQFVPGVRQIDEAVVVDLHGVAAASPAAVEVFLRMTAMGAAPFLIWYSAGVVIVLLLLRRWQLAAVWTVVQLVGLLLIEGGKLAFGRPRPGFNGVFTYEETLSFPSGHALASMTAFGMLAFLISNSRFPPIVRRTAAVLCFILIAMIGFSRLFLGVHYLTDVLGGFALGGAWLCLAVGWMKLKSASANDNEF